MEVLHGDRKDCGCNSAASLHSRVVRTIKGVTVLARALRIFAHGAAVDVIAVSRFGRERPDLYREPHMEALQKEPPSVIGSGGGDSSQ